MSDREITFKISAKLGVINTGPDKWTKELNVIEWNGGRPKYDIREWDPTHERMSRGITLTEKEMFDLANLYTKAALNIDLEKIANYQRSTSLDVPLDKLSQFLTEAGE